MTPERWQKVKDVCYAVLDCAREDRDALLASLCAGDDDLRREVLVMVADVEAASVTERVSGHRLAAAGALPYAVAGIDDSTWRPDVIGGFRILRVIGEGGMGIVYEARQQEPSRTVALKVIRPGLANADVLRRFKQEAQALGRLQHPGIAQIYEAGTAETPFGPQPYFAMEFIHGMSLKGFVAHRSAGLRDRLELVARICDAVQHAHQRGLIHRDLKPSNILVDETGQPKVLDFGVARLTDTDVPVTRNTDQGQLIGTLAYMSPEQVLADPLELDTRSDVYALGVILYELLAGQLPYTVSTRIHEAVKTIQHEDPKRLSSISRVYRGDLETIAAKALEKDKARRYGSAAALAADIRRYLQNEPISARPASASYQLQKFARRHRGVVLAVCAVMLVLAAGIVATAREAIRARRAERTAVAAEETAAAINDFLRNDVLAQASAMRQARPGQKPDPDLKVRTALERAAASIGERFQSRPLVEASIRQTIGETYRELGAYPEALAQLDRALALRRAGLGDAHTDTLESMHLRGHVLWLQGHHDEAVKTLSTALEALNRSLGENHPQSLQAMNSLGMVYKSQGEYAKAEPLLSRYVEAMRATHGEEHKETALALSGLGSLYQVQAKYKEAEPLFTRALDVRRRLLGAEHPETLGSMVNLGLLYRLQTRYKDAEALYGEALGAMRRVLGNDHSETAILVGNLGNLYSVMGDYAKAEPLLIESMEMRLRIWGENHPDTAIGVNNVATLYSAIYRRPDSERFYARALEIRRRTLGDTHLLTHQSIGNLAIEYRVGGKYEEAQSLLAESLPVLRSTYGEAHPQTLYQARGLASVYRLRGMHAEAEAVALATIDAARRAFGDDHTETLIAEEELASLRLAQGRPDDAIRLASRTLGVRRRLSPPTNAVLLRTLVLLGRAHLQRKDHAEAERLFREASAAYAKVGNDKARGAIADSLLGRALAAQGKIAEAEPILASACQRLEEHKAALPSENAPLVQEAQRALAGARRRPAPRLPTTSSEWNMLDVDKTAPRAGAWPLAVNGVLLVLRDREA